MIRNLAWAGLHHGVGRGAMFVFFMALPALLPIADVGRFTMWYTALLVLCQPPLDAALTTIVVTSSARGDLGTVRAAFAGGVRLLPLLLGAAWLASLLTPAPRLMVGLLVVAFALTLPLNLVFAYFRGREELAVEGVVGTLHKLAGLGLLVALAAAGVAGPELPAAAMAAAGVIGWALLAGLAPRRARGLLTALRAAPAAAKSGLELLRSGWELGAVGIVGLLYLRLDVLMLGLLSDAAEVGSYFTAAKVLEAAFLVPHVVLLVVFPRLVKATDRGALVRRTAVVLGGLSLVAVAVVVALAQWAIPALYPAAPGRLAELLLWLAPTVLAVYPGYLVTQTLVVLERQRRYLQLAVAGLGVNLALNAVLIPLYQGVGAALATVVTEAVVTLAAAWAVRSALRTRASSLATT